MNSIVLSAFEWNISTDFTNAACKVCFLWGWMYTINRRKGLNVHDLYLENLAFQYLFMKAEQLTRSIICLLYIPGRNIFVLSAFWCVKVNSVTCFGLSVLDYWKSSHQNSLLSFILTWLYSRQISLPFTYFTQWNKICRSAIFCFQMSGKNKWL